jgi:hypothetical protein
MGKHEAIVPAKPPAPSAPAVRTYRRTLELERDVLRAGAIELAVASAKGDSAAREALAAMPGRLAALQFEIDLNFEAVEQARKLDADAEAAWRTLLQAMDPKDLIAGIGRDACCHRCTPGSPGGCVITASAPHSGGACGHPIRERHLFHINERGLREFRYGDNPQSARIFFAAVERLGVRKEFA